MENYNHNKLVAFSIGKPYLIVVVCLFVIILGTLSLFQLPKDLLPVANLPAVQILSFYSGMPVRDVEENLTARFERYTGQAIGVKRQESKSLAGVSIVTNYFTSDIDLNTALTQTTSLVMSVLRKLPPGAQPPLILPFDPMSAEPLALVAVSAEKPIQRIYDTARYDVRNAIQAVRGAMAPTVMGGMQREVTILLDSDKLKNYNFSPTRVLEKLSRLDTFIPTGDIKIGDLDYQILSNALVEQISEMNNFPLRSEFGTPIYLRDVGGAQDGSQIQTNTVLIDGKEQVYVPIYRQPGGNSLSVVEQAKEAIAKLEKSLGDTKLTLVADQSVFVRHAINSISEEALLGGGLAALMIFLFLGNPYSTFGILLSLPLSLLFAFIGLRAFGETINAMTLGGIALSIGVLVDNSIVVLENISKKLERGESRQHAALEGASQVAMPVFAATLSTLVVLFPVVFLDGVVKILFAALAKSVVFIMIGSYLAAMTVMPLFASHFLNTYENEKKFYLFILTKTLMHNLTLLYGYLLGKMLEYKKLVVALAIAIFIVGVLLAPSLGTELFPRADSGDLTFMVRMETGTRIEKTTEFSKVLEKKIREIIPSHDLAMIITNVGVYYGFPAAFTPNTGTQDFFYNIELTDDRIHTSQYYAKIIREEIKKEYPQLEIGFQTGGLLTSALNMGAKSPINVQIEGPDVNESHKIAETLVPKLQVLAGAADVMIQQRFDMPVVYLDIDREQAMKMGIFTDEIVKDVVSAVTNSSSYDSSNIWVDPKTGIDYLIGVQFPENEISTIEQLGEIPVQGYGRQRVLPLSKIASISKSKGQSQANHVNLKPVIDIFMNAEGRDIGSLSKDVIKVINASNLPNGYSAKILGEIDEMQSSIQSLGWGFILAAVLVYLILVIQFSSFKLPLVIMVSVPLGLTGIVIMLLITNTYFSIQAAIGAIFMIGIAVANGVLLIEFITHEVKHNEDYKEAIVHGAKVRLRPILMTSLASILGLVPMAIGFGHGSEANIPLGRAVIGGQMLSTLVTLFVVPVLYSILFKKEHPIKKEST